MDKLQKPHLILFLLLFLLSLLLNLFFLYQNRERSRVVRVVDGDSFQTKDGRRIRLLGLDAPEKGRCFAAEAKEELTHRVLGKVVRLTDVVTDDYGRLLAHVYVGNTFVNEVLVGEGLTKFSGSLAELRRVATLAKEEKKGIFSDVCRSKMPIDDCVIKGNIRAGEKIYHLPECFNYEDVIIDESFGDLWFCSEQEALSAGFRKARGC